MSEPQTEIDDKDTEVSPTSDASSVSNVADAVPAHHHTRRHDGKERNKIDGAIADIRRRSPAWLVNSGSQINLGLKGSADVMSVWSSIRKGSQSPNRLVASLLTLGAEVLGIFYKEKAVSDEQQRDYKAMSWPKYLVTKTLEAFNPKDHIAETYGVTSIINGIFTVRSGIAQSVKTRISWEIVQGAMTTAAGLLLTYMPDRERAWQASHTVFLFRAPPAGIQAWNAYHTGVPEKGIIKGDWQQGAKWILNQSSNFFAILYSGVKKLPDGSIVSIGKDGADDLPQKSIARDHKHVVRTHAHEQSDEAVALNPSTHVSHISKHDVAMPLRLEEIHKETTDVRI